MKKQNIFVSLISIAVICIIIGITAATGAWFTDTDSADSSTITIGNPVLIETTGKLDDTTVMPGSIVEFGSVQVKAKSDTSDMYVRAYVSIQGSAGNQLTITSAGNAWVEYGGYFYYTTQQTLNSASTLSVLTSLSATQAANAITLKAVVTEGATEETLKPGSTITCEIIFQAIQVANTGDKTIEAMKNEWGELSTSQTQVTLNKVGEGEVSYELAQDNTITLKATPAEGYTLIGWREESTGKIYLNSHSGAYIDAMFSIANVLPAVDCQSRILTSFIDINFSETERNLINNNRDAILSLMVNLQEGNAIANTEILDMIRDNIIITKLPYAFGSYTALFTNKSPTVQTDNAGYTYSVYEELGLALLDSYSGLDTDITIPSSCLDIPVVGFDQKGIELLGAMKQTTFQTEVTRVVLPDTITTLPAYAFKELESLVQVYIPNSVTFIGSYSFLGCSDLEIINFENDYDYLLLEGSQTFYDCTSLSSINFQNIKNIKLISANWMFLNCSSLQELNISSFDTSEIIDMYQMFSGCTALTEINMGLWETENVSSYAHMLTSVTATITVYDQASKTWLVDQAGYSASKINVVAKPAA